MATLDHQPDRYASVLRMQQAESDRDRTEREQLWLFVWVLFGFKLVSVAVLIWWIEWDTFLYVVGMSSWPWLIIPGAALAGPVLHRLRMRRVRKRRQALRRSEFEVKAGDDRTFILLDANGEFSTLRDGADSAGGKEQTP